MKKLKRLWRCKIKAMILERHLHLYKALVGHSSARICWIVSLMDQGIRIQEKHSRNNLITNSWKRMASILLHSGVRKISLQDLHSISYQANLKTKEDFSYPENQIEPLNHKHRFKNFMIQIYILRKTIRKNNLILMSNEYGF